KLQLPEVADASEATAAARKLLDEGVDGIKVYAASLGWPTVLLPESAIQAAAHEAHLRNKLVFAHPQTLEGLQAAVHGGADILVHTAPNAGQLDEATLALMKKAGIAVIPTLKLWKHELRNDRTSLRDRFVKAGVDQLRAWVSAEGTVLFGTDVGYMDDYDTTDEFVLMAEAGMDARQILASLTTAPARRFGESRPFGRVSERLAAGLV